MTTTRRELLLASAALVVPVLAKPATKDPYDFSEHWVHEPGLPQGSTLWQYETATFELGDVAPPRNATYAPFYTVQKTGVLVDWTIAPAVKYDEPGDLIMMIVGCGRKPDHDYVKYLWFDDTVEAGTKMSMLISACHSVWKDVVVNVKMRTQ